MCWHDERDVILVSSSKDIVELVNDSLARLWSGKLDINVYGFSGGEPAGFVPIILLLQKVDSITTTPRSSTDVEA